MTKDYRLTGFLYFVFYDFNRHTYEEHQRQAREKESSTLFADRIIIAFNDLQNNLLQSTVRPCGLSSS